MSFLFDLFAASHRVRALQALGDAVGQVLDDLAAQGRRQQRAIGAR